MYRISKDKVGRVGESINLPLEDCDKLVGFMPHEWIEIKLWIEEVYETIKDFNDTR